MVSLQLLGNSDGVIPSKNRPPLKQTWEANIDDLQVLLKELELNLPQLSDYTNVSAEKLFFTDYSTSFLFKLAIKGLITSP